MVANVKHLQFSHIFLGRLMKEQLFSMTWWSSLLAAVLTAKFMASVRDVTKGPEPGFWTQHVEDYKTHTSLKNQSAAEQVPNETRTGDQSRPRVVQNEGWRTTHRCGTTP